MTCFFSRFQRRHLRLTYPIRTNTSLAFQEVFGFKRKSDAIDNGDSSGGGGMSENESLEENPVSGLVIHGLLGAGRNWRSISQTLATQMSNKSQKSWQMTLVDLRNHGASAAINAFQPPHDIQSTAQDLIDFYTHQKRDWPMIVTGHSLGGKVALEYVRLLQQVPDSKHKLPRQVWILDSQLGPVSTKLVSNSKVDQVFETIHSIPLPIPSRKWLYHHVRNKRGLSLEVAHWLGSNLVGHPNGPLQWVFNVQGAAEMYASYKSIDCWEVARNPPTQTNINIVRARNSDRWNEELIMELEENTYASKTKVHVLDDCGHWLHADNPSGLIDLMLPSLISL